MLVAKVSSTGATLVLTSVRAQGGEVLSIKVERLEGRVEPAASALPLAASGANGLTQLGERLKAASSSSSPANGPLPLRIGAHIRARGDMSFADVPWAGRVAPGLWIESFSIKPMAEFEAGDIEYKGLTGSGFETPWLSDDKMCGTKGMSVPLVGFAVRLKPSPRAASFDCEYSGCFKSGAIIGPVRNGAPCRSTVANDPLEGIQVRITRRPGAGRSTSLLDKGVRLRATPPPAPRPPAANGTGPSFGRYRDGNGHGSAAPASTPRKPMKGKPAPKRAAPESRKPR